MIEQIGNLRSHLNARGLPDLEALDQRHGYGVGAWSHHIARRCIPETANGAGRAGESSGIDPLADRLSRAWTNSGNRVRLSPVRVERVEAATTGVGERTH